MISRACFMAALATTVGSSTALADLVYSQTTQTGSRLTGTTNATVTFDDVFVSIPALNGETSLRVTSVTVGIRRITAAPAVTLSVWWADMEGTALGNANPGVATMLSTTSLAANAGGSLTQLITVSNVAGLFDVTPNQGITDAAGFAGFYIGLQMDSLTSNLNGWRITSGGSAGASSGNAYQYDVADPENPLTNGQFNFGPAPQPGASFYIVVEGTPFTVPTPGAAGLAGLGMLVAVRRRR